MRRLIPALLFAASPTWANFAQCVLDKAHGAATDVAANAIWRV